MDNLLRHPMAEEVVISNLHRIRAMIEEVASTMGISNKCSQAMAEEDSSIKDRTRMISSLETSTRDSSADS